MRARHLWGAVSGLLVIALMTSEGAAQARRHKSSGGNPHAFHRKRPSHPRAEQHSAPAAPQSGWNAAHSDLIVSVESIASFSYYRQTFSTDANGASASATVSGTSLGLLRGVVSEDLVLEQPRLAFDAVIGTGFTIGGSVGYSRYSASADYDSSVPLGPTPNVDRATWALLVQPRLGYVLAASPVISVWLRAGVFILRENTKAEASDDELEQSAFGLVLDPMLVVSPIPHVGLLLGPQLDFGLTGGVTLTTNGRESPELDHTRSSYGVSAGVALLF